jgi:hypothetical protein
MGFHRNAKLGLAGRQELVLRIARGSSIREAAACGVRKVGSRCKLAVFVSRTNFCTRRVRKFRRPRIHG